MAVSPDVLIAPQLKVQRARTHIQEIIDKTRPLYRPWHNVAVEPDILPPQAKPTGFTLRYRPLVPIAENLALIIGDTVHNLRAALDHLATGIVNSGRWKSQGVFPMARDRADLSRGQPKANLDLLEVALPGSVHLLFDTIRPANGQDERLWAFHQLDNDDKHNFILPTVAVSQVRGINVTIRNTIIEDCSVGGDATMPINLIESDRAFTVDRNPETIVVVSFGNDTVFAGEPVVPTLSKIADLVEYTLQEFGTLIGQSGRSA